MIDTIIFDIGKVLVDFCWEKMFHELGFNGDVFETIANATVRHQDWNEFDKGLVSTEEIIDTFAAHAPEYRDEIAKIYDHPENMLKLYGYAIPWIQELKARGYKVYILSNWSEPAYYACLDNALRFLDLVDGAVFSFQEHVIKPDKKIFEIICNRYDIDPAKAVFLDDNAGNIESAREFGLNAIHFQCYEQARSELQQLTI